MFCTECGAQQPNENVKFCANCGAPIAGAASQGVPAQQEGDAQPVQPTVPVEPAIAQPTEPAEPVPAQETQPVQAAVPVEPTAQMPAVAAPSADPQPQAAAQPNYPQPPVSAQPGGSQGPAGTGSASPAPGGMNKKVIGVIVAVVVVIALIAAFAAGSCSSSAGNSSAGSASSAAPADASGFVGEWQLESGTADGLDADEIAALADMGLFVTMTLDEGGSGTFALFSAESDITWKVTSSTEGTVVIDGSELNMELSNGELTVSNADTGDYMVFVPAGTLGASGSSSSAASSASASSSSASASSSSASASSSASSSSSTPTIATGMQSFGSPKVGYVQVPKSWVDRTSEDVDPHNVDDYGMMLVVNPDSEYTSAAQQHYAFSQAIQMTVQPTSYKDIAKQIADSYKANSSMFGDVDQGTITIGGRDAILITTTLTEDNLQICSIVIDRDGDGKVAVALACNCGASDAQAEEVLSYAATWSYK